MPDAKGCLFIRNADATHLFKYVDCLAENEAYKQMTAANLDMILELSKNKEASRGQASSAKSNSGNATKQTSAGNRRQRPKQHIDIFEKGKEVWEMAKNGFGWKQHSLPCQSDLVQLHTRLSNLPSDLRAFAENYYMLGNIQIFLVQCGDFDKLCQFWRHCSAHVKNGGNLTGMAAFLKEILALHKAAFPNSRASALATQPGDPYDSDTQDRVGDIGAYVASQKLPGLINSEGELECKILVCLRTTI